MTDVYLVGGAVRDELLERPVHERDWVVVGATADELRAAGYRQVGRDFPVFLHPDTHEEHALARTERKRGRGHHGFVIDASPEVTLEQDLVRRDLTINAMARAGDGRLIDPYGGERDLQARVLRHVSPAFVEDPLRVFRVARFAAQLAPYGFTVAAETSELMKAIAASGELVTLSAERVWAELAKALRAQAPRFIAVLRDADALAPWFAAWSEVTIAAAWPAVLDSADDWQLPRSFAALCGELSSPQVEGACELLGPPRNCIELARLLAAERQAIAGWRALDDEALLALWQRCDGFRRAERFAALAQVAELLDGTAAKGIAALLRAVSARRVDLTGVADPAGAQRRDRLAALADLRAGY